MPFGTVLMWAICLLSGFIWGIYILWDIEKSGVERWGGNSGGIFRTEKKE
jgi:hypothetical protein